MTLTKKDIIEKVRDIFERAPKRARYSRYNRYNTYTYRGLSKSKCKHCVESLFEIIKETLAKQEDILVSGFGKFCIKRKNARMGRNPAANKRMILKKRRLVTFQCSGKLREAINKKQETNG